MLDPVCYDAAASWRKERLLLKCTGVAVWGEEGGCEGRYCCGSGEINMVLLWEQTLLRQWGGIDGAPAGAGTAAAVGKRRELLRERTLLRQWGNMDCAPAGADTAAAVGKYR